MSKIFEGFKNFILRGNAVDLAVGVVIGASFGTVVTTLVKGLLTPFIGAVARVPDFSGLYFTLNNSKFLYGEFINALISFLLVSAAIYFCVILPMNTFMSKVSKPKAVTTKKCPECLSDIPVEAKRCAHCSQLVLEESK